jgi:hypothetical protein
MEACWCLEFDFIAHSRELMNFVVSKVVGHRSAHWTHAFEKLQRTDNETHNPKIRTDTNLDALILAHRRRLVTFAPAVHMHTNKHLWVVIHQNTLE